MKSQLGVQANMNIIITYTKTNLANQEKRFTHKNPISVWPGEKGRPTKLFNETSPPKEVFQLTPSTLFPVDGGFISRISITLHDWLGRGATP